MSWIKRGFSEFSKGILGNGGQNIYVSAKGVLQRIYNFDINGDGWFDLPLANSHSMDERPPVYIFDELQGKPVELPTHGAFAGIFADLNGDGTEDLVLACQHNGVHSDVSAIIYYASGYGISQRYRSELRVPNSTAVAAGDFKGCGKQALAFTSGDKLRVFYQTPQGIEASVFADLPIAGISLAAGDLDGDGYDDLYVYHQPDGHLCVYWGGEDGIDPERKTEFGTTTVVDFRGAATTAGRMYGRWVPWKVNILDIGGKKVCFRVEKGDAVFESFGADRQPKEEYRFTCLDYEKLMRTHTYTYRGITHAACGDLKNNGTIAIAIATNVDRDMESELLVLWEEDGYCVENATRIPVRYPRSLSVGAVGTNGENLLLVAQGGMRDDMEVDSGVFRFDGRGNASLAAKLPSMDAMNVISGRTCTDGRRQVAVINHEGAKMQGLEDISIFLGGPDGFEPDRKISFPGCAAVAVVPCDLTDDGLPDVIVVNSSENAPHLDPGFEIFYNSPEGFERSRKDAGKVHLGHGCVVGDFRRCGYLDIFITPYRSRMMYLFEGGPNGYDFKNPKKLVLGPDPQKCDPFTWPVEDQDPDYSDEENALINKFGGFRNPICADFNGDGWLDIFLPQLYGANCMILWGGPEGFSVENMQILATDGVVTANAADLNGDGYLDLVLGGFTCIGKSQVKESYYTVYWGGPKGYQENRKTQLPAFCTNDLTIQDFNNDGVLDIYGCAYYGVRTRDADSTLYYGSREGIFYLENHKKILNHSGTGCMSGDFNGDGYIDLAVASHKEHGHHVCDSYVYWGGPDGINVDRCTRLPGRGPHGMCTVDPGNIMDRSDMEYYYSEAYPVPDGKKPVKASWMAENGVKTWVKLYIRTADSEETLKVAPYSGAIENGGSLVGPQWKRFIQYKLELGAPCGCGTPRVTQVRIDFA